ncbi:unnamed protein product [Didymodactylos carnosus]|uniref:Uncharacterized protein n=1 Tax=Didymodactylos carnosus TaxID=1234261 RepID=A0A815GLC8_9BILA|nr:unnamed protein product [Didymodactylos carnosus]CAF4200009.1 unnamed protein product [Didymodactylos carnosus]
MENNQNTPPLISLGEQQPLTYQNEWLQKFIDDNKTKEAVNLFYKSMNVDDMKIIANELITNKTWIVLNFSGSPITAKGCQYLCNALEKNSTLKHLFLSFNHLGDGAQFVWELLLTDKNKTIQSIDFSQTELTDNCIDKVVGIIKKDRMRYISLDDAHLSKDGKQQLRQAAIDNNYTGVLYL